MQQMFININNLIYQIFNDILIMEQQTLKSGVFNDISVTEVHTIEAVDLYAKKTMSEVAKKLNITLGTLTVAINNLVKKGYVEKTKSNLDKRVVRVSLTKKGRVMYRAHAKFHADMVKEAFMDLKEEEANILENVLSNLHKYLSDKNCVYNATDTISVLNN